MASNHPDQCCTIGVKHEGEPKGSSTTFASYPSYVVYPEKQSTEKAIVIFTDVIGNGTVNVQLVADQFAANGYWVVIPDLFTGDPIPMNRPPDFDLRKWLNGGYGGPKKTADVVDPIVTKVIKEMRSQGAKKLGAVGYCFGGKYVARFLGQTGSENNAMLDAGFTAHPSLLEEEELQAIRGPISIAAAETDTIFPEEKRHKTEQILKELAQGEHSIPYQINLYSHCAHGFAVRGDITKRPIKFAKEAAFLQVVQWFQYHLDGSDLN